MARLEDDVAIVTGAARGIGAAYAKALAAEGAKVVVTDILDPSAAVGEITKAGGTAIGIVCDVTDNAAVDAMVTKTVSEFGKIDALVNNAALFAEISHKKFEDIPDGEWSKVMQVNIEGVWRVSKAVVPHMRVRQYGKIVNVASTTALKGTADDAALRVFKRRHSGDDQSDGAGSWRRQYLLSTRSPRGW